MSNLSSPDQREATPPTHKLSDKEVKQHGAVLLGEIRDTLRKVPAYSVAERDVVWDKDKREIERLGGHIKKDLVIGAHFSTERTGYYARGEEDPRSNELVGAHIESWSLQTDGPHRDPLFDNPHRAIDVNIKDGKNHPPVISYRKGSPYGQREDLGEPPEQVNTLEAVQSVRQLLADLRVELNPTG
jgi:hypothetical protein